MMEILEDIKIMTVKIKKIEYVFPVKDIFHDILDVLIYLEDNYCTQDFCYLIEVTTPQFLLTMFQKEKSDLLLPDYPFILVSNLSDHTIRAAVESFIKQEEDTYWLKLYHLIPKLNLEDVN